MWRNPECVQRLNIANESYRIELTTNVWLGRKESVILSHCRLRNGLESVTEMCAAVAVFFNVYEIFEITVMFVLSGEINFFGDILVEKMFSGATTQSSTLCFLNFHIKHSSLQIPHGKVFSSIHFHSYFIYCPK